MLETEKNVLKSGPRNCTFSRENELIEDLRGYIFVLALA